MHLELFYFTGGYSYSDFPLEDRDRRGTAPLLRTAASIANAVSTLVGYGSHV